MPERARAADDIGRNRDEDRGEAYRQNPALGNKQSDECEARRHRRNRHQLGPQWHRPSFVPGADVMAEAGVVKQPAVELRRTNICPIG